MVNGRLVLRVSFAYHCVVLDVVVGPSVLQLVLCNYLLFNVTPAVVRGCWTVSSTVCVL